jgi:hypothetical protein
MSFTHCRESFSWPAPVVRMRPQWLALRSNPSRSWIALIRDRDGSGWQAPEQRQPEQEIPRFARNDGALPRNEAGAVGMTKNALGIARALARHARRPRSNAPLHRAPLGYSRRSATEAGPFVRLQRFPTSHEVTPAYLMRGTAVIGNPGGNSLNREHSLVA